MSEQKSKIQTIKKFLNYEFIELQKMFANKQQNINQDKAAEELKLFFEEFLFTLKDKVRLVNNKKEIEEACQKIEEAKLGNKEDVYSNQDEIDFGRLLEENQTALETNQSDSEQLIHKIQTKLGHFRSSIEKENEISNVPYFCKREAEIKKEKLDLKIENLELRKLLEGIKSKYEDDNEMYELMQEKAHLRSALKEKQSLINNYQNQIFMKNKHLCEVRRQATSNINTLVIHFQTEILSQVKFVFNYRWKVGFP